MQRIRAHPLVTFFVLAFALTWVVWIPRALGADVGSVGQFWTWMPAVAALLTAALTGGWSAIQAWARRLVIWRVGWRWYALVLLGPAAFSLAVAALYAVLGGSWRAALPWLGGPVALLPLFLLVLTLTDGFGEEPAWRGFALPLLLERHTALFSSLVVGVLWACWHLPLIWTESSAISRQPWWVLLVDLTAKSVVFTWVFLRTRGSVLMAALLHGATNLFVVSPSVAVAGDLTLPLLAAAAKVVLAAVIVAGWRSVGVRA